MRCYADQLTRQLNNSVSQFYMVFGDEPYQEANCVSHIKTAAQQQGFDEIVKFSLLPGFDWHELTAQYNSMSLFSARTIIEFDLNHQKPGLQGAAIFKELVNNPNPDVVLILKGAKASQDIQRTAWFKALDKLGIFVPCYPLTGGHLTRWLENECTRLNLHLSYEAKSSLLSATQGNLLAAHQELEKLSLLYKNEPINEVQVMAGLLNQAKFDIFDLNKALLSGHTQNVINILAKLNDDNVEVTSILWAISKESHTLLAIKNKLDLGDNITQLFKQHAIWKNQQPLFQQALSRLNEEQLEAIICLLAKFENALKQGKLIAPFQGLAHIALHFCQPISFEPPF
jgi:DNA polymerase III subunit delta